MGKKIIAGIFIFVGIALLIGPFFFLFNRGEESSSLLKLATTIISLLIGVGSSIKGWKDLFKKDVSDYGKQITFSSKGNTKTEDYVLMGDHNSFAGKINNIAGRDIDKQTESETHDIVKSILAMVGGSILKISIGHPKLVSKGYESPFVVQLYFEEVSNMVKTAIIKEIVGENYEEHIYDTELKLGQVINIKLFSPDIFFPDPIVKKLKSSVNSMTFLGKPLDTCQPREHKVVLSISDNETGIEYQSETFSIKVVDFIFGKVSRPLFSKVSTTVLGIGSFVMFILTLFEQIDKTVGLTSGTAAGVLASVVYANFYNVYQRIRPNTP